MNLFPYEKQADVYGMPPPYSHSELSTSTVEAPSYILLSVE